MRYSNMYENIVADAAGDIFFGGICVGRSLTLAAFPNFDAILMEERPAILTLREELAGIPNVAGVPLWLVRF